MAWLVYLTAIGDSTVATTAGSVVLSLATLGVGLAWLVALHLGKRTWSKPFKNILFCCWLAIISAIFIMPVTYWPIRLSFALLRPQFEQLARRIEQGDVPTKPVCIGFYTVTLAERKANGLVCLWVNSDGDPRFTGFGKCPAAEVPNNFFNLNVHVALADDWQFVEQD